MTPEHKAAMRAGRDRARIEAQTRAVQRVKVYVRWSKAGADISTIPPIPSSADFRAARKLGAIR